MPQPVAYRRSRQEPCPCSPRVISGMMLIARREGSEPPGSLQRAQGFSVTMRWRRRSLTPRKSLAAAAPAGQSLVVHLTPLSVTESSRIPRRTRTGGGRAYCQPFRTPRSKPTTPWTTHTRATGFYRRNRFRQIIRRDKRSFSQPETSHPAQGYMWAAQCRQGIALDVTHSADVLRKSNVRASFANTGQKLKQSDEAREQKWPEEIVNVRQDKTGRHRQHNIRRGPGS